MPISVSCSCGARLEIDEKFLGKEILCPDCQRPLPTKPPATPPPLNLPDNRRVSGLAVLSLTLALVGAFLPPITIAAIFVGVLALRAIAARPNKLEGVGFARAGIIIGAVCTMMTVAALSSWTIFGLDRLSRDLAMAGRIAYAPKEDYFESIENIAEERVAIKRLSDDWGKYISDTKSKIQPDNLIIVNLAEDAYVAAQKASITLERGDEREKKVLDHFHKSELVNLLGRLHGKALDRVGEVVERKDIVGSRYVQKELILDLRLSGLNRRFILHYSTDLPDHSLIFVACARKNRFERLETPLREILKDMKLK